VKEKVYMPGAGCIQTNKNIIKFMQHQ